jgi:DNA (cytosine-5)-methyltransferase 1
MTAYYNEFDPYAAQWLRNLIKAGHIAPGIVDERSIEDVCPDDLKGFTQCHFFAGIGVWSLALRRAGWPDDRPVWTGSAPCQPFSAAGAGAGFADPRHLWPSFAWLISQCRPKLVFGEQVASKAVEPWVDLVHADLEALGYAFGAVPFPSAGVGALHIRDRLFWVADADYPGLEGRWESRRERGTERPARESLLAIWLANPESTGWREQCANASGSGERSSPEELEQRSRGSIVLRSPGPANGFWGAADWIGCRDGKWRPVEPGTSPLADGTPSRVGRLRAYGNAINAEAAHEFIAAYLA